ncbi:hypothetical protein BOX15_Mlig007898g1 [Macrostomum lignano]|uniref:Thioredoxin domain-containing protein n=2 Tax=Macrostomum lignano TaxID=282301 RepID=A0A267EE37_9PLAT|nr:hypothetical protein BOX15_Mlig007898g1 [Macrostomum lignano]
MLAQYLLTCFLIFSLGLIAAEPVGLGSVTLVNDLKELKRIVKSHNNVLLVFQKKKNSASDWNQILTEVSNQMIGQASIVKVDCSAEKKACKYFKASPSPVQIQHYKDGKFNVNYDRKKSVKSLRSFLEDPTGDVPWDEEPKAESVTHLANQAEMMQLFKRTRVPVLLMFYAPWCGHCKRLKPEYASAAAETKDTVLAAMDVDREENAGIRQAFNITGYPTIIYIKGNEPIPYGGTFTKDGILSWLKNPTPPKAPEPEKDWAEEAPDVKFLTDNNFVTSLAQQSSALVMFYAPWCGHCKAMKPAYQAAAQQLKQLGIPGLLAAVDATKYRKTAEQFNVTGFPSVKYFQNAEYKFDFNERAEDKIVEFMKDPKEPPPPPVEVPWSEEPSEVHHLAHGNFADFLKKKRRTLVMFYAPWCGHCKRAKPEFTKAAAELAASAPKTALAAVDCTSGENSALCQAEGVSGYPTIKHYYFGKRATDYAGGREAAEFVKYMTSEDKVEL